MSIENWFAGFFILMCLVMLGIVVWSIWYDRIAPSGKLEIIRHSLLDGIKTKK